MPGVVAALGWTLYALARQKRTTCAAARRVATVLPGGRWLLLGVCVWFTHHLCSPMFRGVRRG